MLLLQERWVLFIVHALLSGPLGFNELNRRASGVSAATLAQRLDLLSKRDVLTKSVLSTMPPRTEYRLTERGAALGPVLRAIEHWAKGGHESPDFTLTPPSTETQIGGPNSFERGGLSPRR